MQEEHKIRDEKRKEWVKYESEPDPLIKAIHKDRAQTFEWVLED